VTDSRAADQEGLSVFTKRTIVSLAVVAMLAASLTLVAAPASAGPPEDCVGNADTAPDGKINADGGPFLGAGEYPLQFLDISVVSGGEQVVFLLKWKNVSDSTRTIRVVDATDFLTSPDTVIKYFVGGVNVSKTMRQEGRLAFFGVQPGKRATLQAILKNRTGTDHFTGAELQGRYGGSSLETCDELVPTIND
jgi:hypothetical protein